MCTHAGQGCAITTRLLVPRSRYDEAVELADAVMAGVTYGDPWDPANLQGPLISAKQRDRVMGYIEKGKAEGARLVAAAAGPPSSTRASSSSPPSSPTSTPKATIAQEEIFGPVLVVIPFEDDDDAVRIANDSIYGLSGAVTTASEERAMAVARRVRTGTLMVNGGFYNARRPLRRLPPERCGARERHRGLRGVPRDQGHRRR